MALIFPPECQVLRIKSGFGKIPSNGTDSRENENYEPLEISGSHAPSAFSRADLDRFVSCVVIQSADPILNSFFNPPKSRLNNGTIAKQIYLETKNKTRNHEDFDTSFGDPTSGSSIHHGCLWCGTSDSSHHDYRKQGFVFSNRSGPKPCYEVGHGTPNVFQQRSHYRKRLSS